MRSVSALPARFNGRKSVLFLLLALTAALIWPTFGNTTQLLAGMKAVPRRRLLQLRMRHHRQLQMQQHLHNPAAFWRTSPELAVGFGDLRSCWYLLFWLPSS